MSCLIWASITRRYATCSQSRKSTDQSSYEKSRANLPVVFVAQGPRNSSGSRVRSQLRRRELRTASSRESIKSSVEPKHVRILVHITCRRVLAVLGLEHAPKEVDRLVQRVDGRCRVHVGPHCVHHLFPRGGEPGPGQEVAEEREDLSSDRCSRHKLLDQFGSHATEVVNIDTRGASIARGPCPDWRSDADCRGSRAIARSSRTSDAMPTIVEQAGRRHPGVTFASGRLVPDGVQPSLRPEPASSRTNADASYCQAAAIEPTINSAAKENTQWSELGMAADRSRQLRV